MFGILENLTKATVGAVTTPVMLVADIATLGGSLTEQGKPYTMQAIEEVYDNLKQATKPN